MATMTNSAITRADQDRAVTATDVGMVILRGVLGLIFVAHGAQKLLGWFGGKGLFATIQMFNDGMGIPPFFAYLAIFTEFFGGLALLFGVLSRLAGLGIAFTMLVAMLKVTFKGEFFLKTGSDPGADGIEYNLALMAMALCVALIGPGSIALGSRLKRLPFFLR